MKKENIFQFIIVLIGIISVVLNFMLFKDWRGVFYYTILSNIYVILFYSITLIIKKSKKIVKNDMYYMFKGLMLLQIMCTMIVYFGIMNTPDSIYINNRLECNMVHVVVPLLVLADFILFEKKGQLKYKFIPIWGSTSVIYLLILSIYRFVLNGLFFRDKEYIYDIIV